MSGAVLALSALSAIGQVRVGQAQAASLRGQAQGFDVQADYERLRGRQEGLTHKRQAVNQLTSILEALARTTAVAGVGNADPFSGNPEGLKIKALNVGGQNYITARENQRIKELVADFQANQFNYKATQARAAAKAAVSASWTNALLTLGQGAFMYAQLGGSMPSMDMSFNTPGNVPTAWRYGTNIGSQQTSMLAQQDAGLYALR